MEAEARVEEIVEGVVFNIADEDACDPLDLPPLGSVVDPDSLERVVRSGDSNRRIEFEYQRRTIRIDGEEIQTMTTKNDDSFNCQCHTCGEETRNVAHEIAQKFFEDHLDRGHAPELVRADRPKPDRPADADGAESGGAARPD